MPKHVTQTRRPPLFITFEGMDGCGKSTQVRALSAYLTSRNIAHMTTREPGGCPLAEEIRSLVLSHAAKGATPLTQALLMSAARKEHIVHTIKPALEKGLWVLSDRFMDSTTVYQGYVQGLGMQALQHLHTLCVGSCMPDLTFIFDSDPETTQVRLFEDATRGAKNHFDTRTYDFFCKVREGFQELTQGQCADRFVLVDATQPIAAVTEMLCTHLKGYVAQ